MALAAALRRAAQLGEPFAVTPPEDLAVLDGPEWCRADELTTDPLAVAALIDAAAARLGTDQRRVAASILFQGYAKWVAAGALAAHVADRVVPDVAAANVAVRWWRGRVVAVALCAPRAAIAAEDGSPGGEQALDAWLLTRLLDDHLAALARTVRAVAGNSPRQLAGNVAATLGGGLTRLQRAGLVRAEADTHRLLARLAERVDRTGEVVAVQHAERRGTFFARATCCHMWRLGDGCCDTCPLVAADERERRWREVLAHETP